MKEINERDLLYVKDKETDKVYRFHYGYDAGHVFNPFATDCIPKGFKNDNYASSWIPCDPFGDEVKIFFIN